MYWAMFYKPNTATITVKLHATNLPDAFREAHLIPGGDVQGCYIEIRETENKYFNAFVFPETNHLH